MLYPAMGELNAQIHNRYMLVNVVAKRARQIAQAYENAHQILNEKPVTTAINEVASGELYDPEEMSPDADAPDAAAEPDDMEPDAETEEDADAE